MLSKFCLECKGSDLEVTWNDLRNFILDLDLNFDARTLGKR